MSAQSGQSDGETRSWRVPPTVVTDRGTGCLWVRWWDHGQQKTALFEPATDDGVLLVANIREQGSARNFDRDDPYQPNPTLAMIPSEVVEFVEWKTDYTLAKRGDSL